MCSSVTDRCHLVTSFHSPLHQHHSHFLLFLECIAMLFFFLTLHWSHHDLAPTIFSQSMKKSLFYFIMTRDTSNPNKTKKNWWTIRRVEHVVWRVTLVSQSLSLSKNKVDFSFFFLQQSAMQQEGQIDPEVLEWRKVRDRCFSDLVSTVAETEGVGEISICSEFSFMFLTLHTFTLHILDAFTFTHFRLSDSHNFTFVNDCSFSKDSLFSPLHILDAFTLHILDSHTISPL